MATAMFGELLIFKIFLVLIYCKVEIQGSHLRDVDRLYDDLIDRAHYNNRTRPIMDQAKPVEVNISLSLVTIKVLDEVSGEFTIVGTMQISWIDERLQWNPSNYNGTMDFSLSQRDAWTPDIVLVNPAHDLKQLGNDDIFTVRYYHTGFAFWHPVDIFGSTCSIDIHYYPFDIQTCSLQFLSWGYSRNEILLHAPLDTVRLDYYTKNGEWDIISTKSVTNDDGQISMVVFSIQLQRIPIFFIISIVLPVLFLAFLNIITFAIPAESGEKVSYAITVFLSFAVFMTILAESLPRTSNPVSLLSYYLMLNLIGSVLICMCTILVLRVYHMEGVIPPPKWLQKFYTCCKCTRHKNKTGNQERAGGRVISRWLDNFLLIVFSIYFLAVTLLFLLSAAFKSNEQI